jgi:thiol-disulfide isomerase/thioredoxin
MPKKKNLRRNRTPIFILLALVVAGVAAGAAMILNISKDGSEPTARPEPIVINNVREKLEEFRGKVVLLNFWATWCGPCRSEIPGFIELQDKYRDAGLQIVGVSIDPLTSDRGGGKAAVSQFINRFGVNYTNFMVESAAAIAGYDLSRGIPMTYLIDRSGRVVRTYLGAQPKAVFEQDIKGLL